MTSFIVDASVAIKWFVDEPGSEWAVWLLDQPLAAPLITADNRLVDKLRATSGARFAGLVLPLAALPGMFGRA